MVGARLVWVDRKFELRDFDQTRDQNLSTATKQRITTMNKVYTNFALFSCFQNVIESFPQIGFSIIIRRQKIIILRNIVKLEIQFPCHST